MTFTDTMLQLETTYPRHTNVKDRAIRAALDITSTRYYQLLNQAIDTREALEADPVTIRRLRRIRDERRRRQAA